MLLESIYLRNYRSFGDQFLDLSGVTAAVVHGPTGSGKSSLIDGTLWALFGVQRGDQFMKLGTDTTSVEVVWSHGGSRYRVVRTRSTKTKAGKSDLSFSARNGDGWQSIGGKTIPETEAAIIRVLGMDYHTLTSGPFSIQGQSDKFTRPPDIRIDGKVYTGRQARIQILAQMLGLGRYEVLHKHASTIARDLDARAATLEEHAATVDAKLAGRPSMEADSQTSAAAIATARQQIDSLAVAIDQAAASLATLDAEIPVSERELAGYADTRAGIASREKTRAQKAGRADHYRALLAQRAQIEAAVTRAEELDTLLAQQRQELAGLAAEGRSAAEAVKTAEGAAVTAEAAAHQAAGRLAAARERVGKRGELAEKVGALGKARMDRPGLATWISEQEAALSVRRSELSRIMTDNMAAQKRAGEIEAEATKKSAERNGLESGRLSCLERAGMVDTVPCRGDAEYVATCPLLQNAREAVVGAESFSAAVQIIDAWVRPEAPPLQDTAPLRVEIATAEQSLADDKATLATLDRTIARLQPAEAELAALDEVQATIPGLELQDEAASSLQIEAAETLASRRDSLASFRRQYTALQATIQTADFERAALITTGADEIPLAERELPILDAEIGAIDAEIVQLQATLSTEATRRTWLTGARDDRARMQVALQQHREDRTKAQRALGEATDRLATARAMLATLDMLEAETAAGRTEAAALRTRHATLTLLAEAYRAIPLMILEHQAIPALETEANRLLSRISRSGMRIRLETQREVKSRDTLADSLDIVVTDHVGTRSYEDYSGGQNFQIDLALRVALAKLQAHRAGQAVLTMILDEGFGTQSAECLDGIVEALREIQKDFPRLLVVSHVEAMRDTFGARISVSGGPEDSRAELVVA